MELMTVLRMMRKRKLLAALLAFQVALTFAIFSNALLAYAEFRYFSNAPKGFAETDLIYVFPQSYEQGFDIEGAMHRDLSGIKAIPGVVDATPMGNLPASGSSTTIYTGPGEDRRQLRVSVYDADASGPRVLDLKLVAGRAPRSDEVVYQSPSNQDAQASVVMVSQSLARELFAERAAVGQTLWMGKGENAVQVIGVFEDVLGVDTRSDHLRSMTLLRPRVALQPNSDPNYLIRVAPGTAASVLPKISARLDEVKGRYVHEISTVDELIRRDLFASIAITRVLGVISLIMLVVVSLGITGLASYSVGKRMREIGTRRALGASKVQILRMVIVEGAVTSALGLLLGIGLALLLNYLAVKSGLLGSGMQVQYLLMCAVFLLVLTSLAVYLPASRASAIDPAQATRG